MRPLFINLISYEEFMKLIIVRHGETIENVKHIWQGHIPGTLTKKGIKQAKLVAIRLKNKKIDTLFSSDLKRTMDTAKEIIRFHPELKIKKDKRLRERYLGKLQGKKVKKDFDWNNPPKDIETNLEMYNRVKGFIDETYKTYKDKTVLIVTHGGTKRAFNIIMNNQPITDFFNAPKFNNTSVSIYEIKEDKKQKIILQNCTKHLD